MLLQACDMYEKQVLEVWHENTTCQNGATSWKVNFLTDQVDRLNRKFMENKGAGSAALQDSRSVAVPSVASSEQCSPHAQDFTEVTEDVGNEGHAYQLMKGSAWR